MQQTPFHAYYTARRLAGYTSDEDKFIPAFASSNIEVYPYQIAAAGFALRSSLLPGCILSDECSLGKTYEALLIAAQKWYEGQDRLLLVLPTNLIRQWVIKIENSFSLPYVLMDNAEAFNAVLPDNPFEQAALVITTYDFAVEKYEYIKERKWDLVIFDEADSLNKAHTGENKTASRLKEATDGAFKLLLTPTPITKDIMDIYGLIHFIDETVLPDEKEFYDRYFRKPENYPELTAWVSRYCFRSLKSQVSDYVNFSNRIPYTISYELTAKEKVLYKRLDCYLALPKKIAFPKMERYNLTMDFYHTLSSSAQAFAETLDGVISRLEATSVDGTQKDLLENEIKLLQEIRGLAKSVEINGKSKVMLSVLKKCFARLKRQKLNQKAIIFTDNLTTQNYLNSLLTTNEYNILTYSGSNSRDYAVMERFRNDKEIQILLSTDTAAKGLDIEFCPVVVNYDILPNALKLEQRISRCHRQGQKSDVLVINLIGKVNYADVRYMELINKRVLQFDGIFGMSDNILGNFDADIGKVLENVRRIEDIQREFDDNLIVHESENKQLVDETESALFTTFTKEVAEKVTVTPQYVEDKIKAINNELWEVVKWYFEHWGEDGEKLYEIDEIEKTVTLKDETKAPKLFTYKLDRGNLRTKFKPYYSLKKYGMSNSFIPHQGRITLTSLVGGGILKSLCCEHEGTITVDADIENCTIGLYGIIIVPKGGFIFGGSTRYYVFAGQTESGRVLSHDECEAIMSLPVLDYTEKLEIPKPEVYGSIVIKHRVYRHSFDDRYMTSSFTPHPLDQHVPMDAFIRRYTEKHESELAEEIESMKHKAAIAKSGLERTLEELEGRMVSLQKEAENTVERIKQMRITKEINTLHRDLMQKEENLFLDGMKIDVELEGKINELVENGKLTGKPYLHYVVEIVGAKRVRSDMEVVE